MNDDKFTCENVHPIAEALVGVAVKYGPDGLNKLTAFEDQLLSCVATELTSTCLSALNDSTYQEDYAKEANIPRTYVQMTEDQLRFAQDLVLTVIQASGAIMLHAQNYTVEELQVWTASIGSE